MAFCGTVPPYIRILKFPLINCPLCPWTHQCGSTFHGLMTGGWGGTMWHMATKMQRFVFLCMHVSLCPSPLDKGGLFIVQIYIYIYILLYYVITHNIILYYIKLFFIYYIIWLIYILYIYIIYNIIIYIWYKII